MPAVRIQVFSDRVLIYSSIYLSIYLLIYLIIIIIIRKIGYNTLVTVGY